MAVQGIRMLNFMLIVKGYPCGHALAVILGGNQNIKKCMKPCFTVEHIANTYAGTIIHPHNIDFAAPLQFTSLEASDDESHESDESETLHPSTKRPPGRPKKHRIQTRQETSEDKPARVQKCTRCRQSGHSKRTCKEAIS